MAARYGIEILYLEIEIGYAARLSVFYPAAKFLAASPQESYVGFTKIEMSRQGLVTLLITAQTLQNTHESW